MAQEPNDSLAFKPQFRVGFKYTIKVSTGGILVGFVIEETKDFVTIENRGTLEKFKIQKSDIENAKIFVNQKPPVDEALGENYHARNYLLSSGAFLFEESSAYSNSHWFLFENLDYALSENFAFSANCIAFYPISAGLKCAFELDKDNHIGANVFGLGNVLSAGSGSMFWGYGAIAKYTRGNSNKNFTFSGGVLGLRSDLIFSTGSNEIVNLAFISSAYCQRINPNIALNAEGWYFPEAKSGMAGLGVKFVGNERICWTLGCFSIFNNFDNKISFNFKTIPIPYIGISKNFN